MSEETNETLEQIEDEIKETQRKAGKEEDFEIEIVDAEDAVKSEDEENTSEDDENVGSKN